MIRKDRSGLVMRSTTAKIFFDTNVLIYASDRHSLEKQQLAREALRSAAKNGTGVISTQVLQEFYAAATRKLGIPPLIAKELMVGFEHMEVVQITPLLIRDAVDTSLANNISFWDALIVIAAKSAACDTLLTEDLNPGQTVVSVRIENPFQ